MRRYLREVVIMDIERHLRRYHTTGLHTNIYDKVCPKCLSRRYKVLLERKDGIVVRECLNCGKIIEGGKY